jgi:hypothetical protein
MRASQHNRGLARTNARLGRDGEQEQGLMRASQREQGGADKGKPAQLSGQGSSYNNSGAPCPLYLFIYLASMSVVNIYIIRIFFNKW